MKWIPICWSSVWILCSLWKPVPVASQNLSPGVQAATLTGVVTNAVTGAPIVGAKITVSNQATWSVSGGLYTLVIDPVGSYPVKFQKAGFDTYTSSPVTFLPGSVVTVDAALWENLNPPYTATAFLDTTLQTVLLTWETPRGNYEILYDDGIQESFTVWAFQGNMNAVKFTPAAYPVTVKGGSVHIGTPDNYPPGSNPLVPFQIAVYDATGPLGMPGSVIGGPFDVIPTGFGWNEFTFPTPVPVTSGNFYLVMIQGGNAPNAAGLAVDQTTNHLRSVSRFVTGGAPWVPAGGNFMLRAQVYGPGGPLEADSFSESLLQYQVWRLRQGEEQNPSVWIDLGTTTALALSDPSWFSLPCGPYRWGIKAHYSGNRSSPVRFSNILGKCWTVNVTVAIDLSCTQASKAGAFIRLKNLVYPDTVYTATVDTSGIHTFPQVWKGSYELSVSKFGYQNSVQTLSVTMNTTVPVLLLQERPPPTGLQVDNKTLVAQWQIPTYFQNIFEENWGSGSFQTQSWTVQGGYNWLVSTVLGNPAPSAMFSWSPQVLNYSQTLTSKQIAGQHSPLLTLSYDIFLDNFGTTTLNQMAVEIWDGTSWTQLKNHCNAWGSIPWTAQQVNISTYTNLNFRIRFRAYGEDSYDINNWNVDNIRITASETAAGLLDCILGYNFYLDNVLSGFTTEPKFSIPGSQVQYGQNYNACVLAVYASGYSSKNCTVFTSQFLYPPRELMAAAVENSVYLEWLKPMLPDTTTPPGLLGYHVYRNGGLLKAINHPDSLNYYDFEVEPGTWHYEVSAWYDLTPYGYPGQFDESMKAGPVTIVLNYGRSLPFFEPWDQASFAYHEWRFTPGQGNWVMDVTAGNPAPSARFSWEPIMINYSYSLESPVLDATPYECASVWLDFDLKLDDQYATGKEKLCVSVYYNNIWHKLTEFANTGSFSWDTKHIDLSPVTGQAFRFRFRAFGENSADILGWYLDNIHVYPVCYPAENLQGEALGTDVYLTWSPPQCGGTGGQLNEGFEGPIFPPSGWEQIINNPLSTWHHATASSSVGVHSGSYSAGILWDYDHQDEWLIVRDILVTGNLTFWSHAFQGSVHNDHYYVKISPDGGNTWDVVLDMSALPPYPSPNGYNQWNTPYEIDMTPFLGLTVDIAWQAVDNSGQGLWYSWAIDDCMVGTDQVNLISYDVFRRTGSSGDFIRINAVPITDTTYLDEELTPQEYQYYVLAISTECLQSEPSDTITVDVITPVNPWNPSQTIRIYPNPVQALLYIQSDIPVISCSLQTIAGQVILKRELQPQTTFQINTSGFPEGLYILMLSTREQSFFFKVVISR